MPAGRLSKRFVRVALQAIPLVFGVILMNFTLIQLLPGDAAEAFAAESGAATPGNNGYVKRAIWRRSTYICPASGLFLQSLSILLGLFGTV